MDNYSKIYWLTRLDSLHTFFAVLAGICGVLLVIYHMELIFNFDMWDDDEKKEYKKNWGKYKNLGFFIGLLAGIVLVFMPTKNDMIMIYAGGKTMDFIQKDSSLSKIPYQTTKIISDYLENNIKELKHENK